MFSKLKAMQLQARKEKNTIRASLLTTLIGEFARSQTKEAPTDAQVFKAIEKLNAGVQQVHAIAPTEQSTAELAIIQELLSYQPSKASDEQIIATVTLFLQSSPVAKMGEVMAHLKQTYGSNLDGKVASKLVSSLLQ